MVRTLQCAEHTGDNIRNSFLTVAQQVGEILQQKDGVADDK